jgi:hypothetical protein
MALTLLLPLVQQFSELATSLTLCLTPVHQLVELDSVFRQDHFPQLRQQSVLQEEHRSAKRSREKIKRQCNKKLRK